MKTVVGSFDNYAEAHSVVNELTAQGFARHDISIVARKQDAELHEASGRSESGDVGSGAATGALAGGAIGGAAGLAAGLAGLAIPGIGPIIAAGPIAAALAGAGVGAAAGGLIGALANAGVKEEDAHVYAENVRRGGALVMLKCDDSRAQTAADIMERHGAIDVDRRGAELRQPGWRGFDETASPYAGAAGTTAAAATGRHTGEREAVIPVVEEELKVGKREVESGGARVHARTVEKPVHEQVRLREEEVEVHRRPADRPATERDIAAARDTDLEFRETREEPVVEKSARVVEEVEISKRASEHTEDVRDSVRRTEVDVDKDVSRTARPRTGRGSQTGRRTPPDRPLR